MASINEVFLMGNVGKDPEKKTMSNGKTVANFSLATNDQWKDKTTGEKKEKTEWHNIVLYDKLADFCAQYVKKGSTIFVKGKINTEQYKDKNGQDRFITKIITNEVKLITSRSFSQATSDNPASYSAPSQPQSPPIDLNDDIPF